MFCVVCGFGLLSVILGVVLFVDLFRLQCFLIVVLVICVLAL